MDFPKQQHPLDFMLWHGGNGNNWQFWGKERKLYNHRVDKKPKETPLPVSRSASLMPGCFLALRDRPNQRSRPQLNQWGFPYRERISLKKTPNKQVQCCLKPCQARPCIWIEIIHHSYTVLSIPLRSDFIPKPHII